MLEALLKSTVWLIACAIVLLSVYVYITFNYWKKRGVEYDKPSIPFGNLNFIMRKSFWDYCLELWKRYPREYVGIYLGLKPALVVQTSDLARRVLTKDFEYFEDRYLYSTKSDPLGSLNLFTVKNPIWKQMRTELSPMFTALRLKYITELMNQNATQLLQKVERDYIKKKMNVDLKELFSMYASDTVAYSVFGIRVSILNDQPSPLWYITSHMVKWTFWRGFEFTMVFLMPAIAAILRLKFFSDPASEYIKNMFWTVAKEREQTRTVNDKDLVNHLLKLKQNLKLPAGSDDKLADDLMLAQAAVFILGSVETSSTTLSYYLHELAHHPEEQEKLHKEVSEALLKSGKDVLQYDELMELKYLSAGMYETLRKYPPVSYLDRICNKNYKLNDDLLIEKGTPVFVNVCAIHYDEQNYPEPTQWKPERFIGVSDGDNLQFTFLPFGEGPRFCIGKRYGMMQIRAAIAQIITKYRIEPAEPMQIGTDPYSVILAPQDGGKVKFVCR